MHNRRLAEVIVVGLGYVVLFVFVIGPAIGAATGFDQPAFDLDSGVARQLPTGVRGGILVLTGAMVMVGYMFLRARIAGVPFDAYWNQQS
ncbi:hypothetical protein M0R89_19425 (plasmid) [Halorussus limi]|uniref:Uncharacterized protein n=1 Tax=Halorussus limi TaxID=2938695 RepID=A0A8U0HYV6_9EURY|nr:hypothetical protein [Halorussus limi]UPV76335.1 hypothetical protein M0R89_19425 [Halorussus limi]